MPARSQPTRSKQGALTMPFIRGGERQPFSFICSCVLPCSRPEGWPCTRSAKGLLFSPLISLAACRQATHVAGCTDTTMRSRSCFSQRSSMRLDLCATITNSRRSRTLLDATVDHRHLNDVLGHDQTTAEAISKWLYDWCVTRWPQTIAVRVCETPRTWAEYRP